MPILGGIGGGNTITGLNFERECDIRELLQSKKGYKVDKSTEYIIEKLKEIGIN